MFVGKTRGRDAPPTALGVMEWRGCRVKAPGEHGMEGLMRPDTLTPEQEQAHATLSNVGGASLPRVLPPNATGLPAPLPAQSSRKQYAPSRLRM